MSILENYAKAGNFTNYRDRSILMRRCRYHSSMADNLVSFVISAPSGETKEGIKDVADIVENILMRIAPHSSKILKLEHWTDEERASVKGNISRAYKKKYNVCLDYIKSYIIPKGWRLYSFLEICPCSLDGDEYTDENGREKLFFVYNGSNKSTTRTEEYFSFLASKNLIPSAPVSQGNRV